ncbi:MAG: Flp1 family type IVb pilin [Lachnospiraceae bacterium]|nr:Flp1 family type IVb pilin [Lachnospiraceae bacterium]
MKTKIYKTKETLKKKLYFQELRIATLCRRSLEGIGVIEVILILVVIIGLILIFKSQLTTIMNSLFKSIKSDIKSI